MGIVQFMLQRDNDPAQKHNYGRLFVDGKYLGETLEDEDRGLEAGGTKIPKLTAIPRGRYRMVRSYSRRFGRFMAEILNVPGFSGIRIHGGNTEANTDGCPLLGLERTPTGIRDCDTPNDKLDLILLAAEQSGDEVWIDVL